MFKNYTSNDNLLLPPCLGDFIPQNDPVRVVHRIIEQINLEELYRRYSPKGCSAYHPRMMLQILVYAYLRNMQKTEQTVTAKTAMLLQFRRGKVNVFFLNYHLLR